jgi:hypothetical protein
LADLKDSGNVLGFARTKTLTDHRPHVDLGRRRTPFPPNKRRVGHTLPSNVFPTRLPAHSPHRPPYRSRPRKGRHIPPAGWFDTPVTFDRALDRWTHFCPTCGNSAFFGPIVSPRNLLQRKIVAEPFGSRNLQLSLLAVWKRPCSGIQEHTLMFSSCFHFRAAMPQHDLRILRGEFPVRDTFAVGGKQADDVRKLV